MYSSETILKVIDHKAGAFGTKMAVVIIEKGNIGPLSVFKCLRTGTEYHLTSTPIYYTDVEVIGGIADVELLCKCYREHPDFATNEKMQKICETKRGFTYGPIHFASIKPMPFRGELIGGNYVNEPERYDIEIGDTLVKAAE